MGMNTVELPVEDRRRHSRLHPLLKRGDLFPAPLIDPAEMYGEGAAEELIGEATRGKREKVLLVSKVDPTTPRGAADLALTEVELGALDRALPRPAKRKALEML